MKNLLPTIACFLTASLCLAQTNIYDDLTHKAGEFLCSESSGLWTTWTNAGGTPEDTYVTDQLSFSSENSIQLVSGGWLMWCYHWVMKALEADAFIYDVCGRELRCLF